LIVDDRIRKNKRLEKIPTRRRVVLARSGVLLLPGSVFTRPSREFRMDLGRRGMAEGLERLDACLSE